jgi:hypothetical protein
MTVVNPALPVRVHYSQAWATLIIALLLGLLTMAAVEAARVDCRDVLETSGGGGLMTPGGGARMAPSGQRCELRLGDLRVPLPQWQTPARVFVSPSVSQDATWARS